MTESTTTTTTNLSRFDQIRLKGQRTEVALSAAFKKEADDIMSVNDILNEIKSVSQCSVGIFFNTVYDITNRAQEKLENKVFVYDNEGVIIDIKEDLLQTLNTINGLISNLRIAFCQAFKSKYKDSELCWGCHNKNGDEVKYIEDEHFFHKAEINTARKPYSFEYIMDEKFRLYNITREYFIPNCYYLDTHSRKSIAEYISENMNKSFNTLRSYIKFWFEEPFTELEKNVEELGECERTRRRKKEIEKVLEVKTREVKEAKTEETKEEAKREKEELEKKLKVTKAALKVAKSRTRAEAKVEARTREAEAENVEVHETHRLRRFFHGLKKAFSELCGKSNRDYEQL